MENTSTDKRSAASLAAFLRRLVDIIEEENNYLRNLMYLIIGGKATVVEINGHVVYLESLSEAPSKITIRPDNSGDSFPNLSTKAEVLSSIISGYCTLDQAIVDNRIMARTPLEDLVDIYRFSMALLAEAPLNQKLQRLWKDFAREWVLSTGLKDLPPLEDQSAFSPAITDLIPKKVAETRVW